MSKIKEHKIDQLTVPELKEELEKRNLPTQGAKAALITRLREAMKSEGYDLEADADLDSEMGRALMQMLLAIRKSMREAGSTVSQFKQTISQINSRIKS